MILLIYWKIMQSTYGDDAVLQLHSGLDGGLGAYADQIHGIPIDQFGATIGGQVGLRASGGDTTQKILFKNVEIIRIITDLEKKDRSIQLEAAKKLQQYLAQYQEDCDDTLFLQFKIMLNSRQLEHVFGALLAIIKVARIGRETRIVHRVKTIMPCVLNQLQIDNKELVEKTAECLGSLAEAGGKVTAEVVDQALNQVIQFLDDDKEPKSQKIHKYSAVLVIREFCKKLPLITFNKLFDNKKHFKLIFNALQDHRGYVRSTAAECINECIKMINARDSHKNDQRRDYLTMIYNEVHPVLFLDNHKDVNYQQSALSILSELIQVRPASNSDWNDGEAPQQQRNIRNNIIMKNEKQIADEILKLIDESKAMQVKKQCVEMVPQLIKHLPEFKASDNLFRKTMTSLFNFMGKKDNVKKEGYENFKGVGFIALGKISLLVSKEQLADYIEKIFELIDIEIKKPAQIIQKDIYYKPVKTTDVLLCIRDLAKNYGHIFESRYSLKQLSVNGFVQAQQQSLAPPPQGQCGGSLLMYDFICSLFYFGFKKPLIEALKELTKISNGQYQMGIQAKLMNTIYIILTDKIDFFPVVQVMRRLKESQKKKNQELRKKKQKTREGGQIDSSIQDPDIMEDKMKINNLQALLNLENQYFIQSLSQGVKDPKQLKKFTKQELEKINEERVQMIILALKALNTFGISQVEHNFNILEFMSESVLPYLFNENSQIRNEAVQTFSSLKFQDKQQLNPQSEILVNKLLHKFFVTATTDTDINIRSNMLMCLNSDFDPFISRYENLLMLFNCMKDSNNDIKIKTIKILGRLTPHNPQQIFPYLRNLIVSLVSQLEHSHKYKEREEAAKLIKAFVKYNRELSKSYAQTILNCLFQRIDQDKKQKITTPFISALLDVMREISFVDPDATKPYIGQIFPLILESVKDQSDFQKREVALNTLIAMIENTGFVVKPYFFYPELLTIIRNLVQSEQVASVRKLVFKLIGTLGAVDPYLINQIILYHKQKKNNEDGEVLENLPQLLGISQNMIISKDFEEIEQEFGKDQVTQSKLDRVMHLNGQIQNSLGFLGLGQAKPAHKEIPIVLDINRPFTDEYLAGIGGNIQGLQGFGLNSNLEATLSKYGISKPEITKENKFSMIAIEQLIKILNDQTLVDHHEYVLRGIKYIASRIGKDSIQFFPLIIPSILHQIALEGTGVASAATDQVGYISKFYECLKTIIDCVPQCITEYQSIIFDTIEQVLMSAQQHQTYQVINLLIFINMRSNEKYIPQMNFILPKILHLIDSKSDSSEFGSMSQLDSKSASSQMTKGSEFKDIFLSALRMIQQLRIVSKDDNLHLIIPLLIRVITRSNYNEQQAEITFKIEIVLTVESLIFCKTFREYIAPIVHSMINVIEVYNSYSLREASVLHQAIVRLFENLARVLKIDFAPFIPLVQQSLQKIKRPSGQFNAEVENITKINLVDLFYQNLENSAQLEQDEDHGFQMLNNFGSVLEGSVLGGVHQNNRQLYVKANYEQLSLARDQEERRMQIDLNTLMKNFDTDKLSIVADWNEWLKKTSFQLLKQSPNTILFTCSKIAEVYSPIASELYNVAFLSIWRILNDPQKNQIIKGIQNSIRSQVKPRAVLQTILNLHEFMQLDENKQKIFDERTLASIAEQCDASAKALYYWEMEFQNDAKSTIEQIIITNYSLGQPEAAKGILISAVRNQLIEREECQQYETPEWLEKRHEWNDALDYYSECLIDMPNDRGYQKGKLRCLKNLYDWENLSSMVGQLWDAELSDLEKRGLFNQYNSENLLEIAQEGLESSWNLGEWDDFSKYIKVLRRSNSPNSFNKSFYQAILDIKRGKYLDANKHIERARQILDPQITSLLGESYSRAYSLIQDLQSLKELEEVIQYVRTNDEQRKKHFYSLWQKRFAVQPSEDLYAYQRSLNLRSIVIDKTEEVDQYIQFAQLAQNSGNPSLGQRVLNKMMKELITKLDDKTGGRNVQKIHDDLAKVKLSIYENDYNNNKQDRAIQMLKKLIDNKEIKDDEQLSNSYLKLSQWTFEFKDQIFKQKEDDFSHHAPQQQVESQLTAKDYEETIRYCKKATEVVKQNNEAWHHYSQINYEASNFYSIKFAESLQENEEAKKEQEGGQPVKKKKVLIPEDYGEKIVKMTIGPGSKFMSQATKDLGRKYIFHIINAIQGLVQQLQLSDQVQSTESSKTLQNTLRLMKIWFRHGNYQPIDDIVRDGIDKINLKVWINVIPQLIARIDIKEAMIKSLLLDLLERLSQKYPQALVYSLMVSLQSKSKERKEAAEVLINKLKLTQNILIEQAELISSELIRAAILLSESWTEAIEDSSRVYFSKNDADTMIENLKDLHKRMQQPPETMNEINFYQGFASDLEEAQLWTIQFQQTKNPADMNQAWDIYFNVFKRIQSKYQNVQFYELRNVAPKLLASENLQIAVPGTFRSGYKITRIAKFSQVLPVFQSKQHPRKLCMMGDDGREYVFLLKGHEDTRQDERVMQLFGLVNTLLSTDPKTCKKNLSIRRYPVIPLSHQAGLIGMVPNCDTLNQLIRDHRTQSNIIFNTETKTMEQMFDNYETCFLLNKVEIFRYAMNNTQGEDLQRVLWLKSQNSELWLERRTNYTRSLAVMSMVGYILGLGDRHPSNILLDRYSGKIIHIDFGDCFESAMRREKYPEKIPFRLTRMLQKAMEVSGIEGNFRNTCENTMRVMRANKDSLLAILEAFVYDPLLSFRLLNLKALMKNNEEQKEVVPEIYEAPSQAQKNAVIGAAAENIIDQIKQKAHKDIRQSIVEAAIEKYLFLNATTEERKSDIAVRTYADKKMSLRADNLDKRKIVEEMREEDAVKKELNQHAEIVVQRINDKLRGTEFPIRNNRVQRQGQSSQINPSSMIGGMFGGGQSMGGMGGMSSGGKLGRSITGMGYSDQQKNQALAGGNNQVKQVKQSIEDQVDLLIQQATNHENLSQCYPGWCPYW